MDSSVSLLERLAGTPPPRRLAATARLGSAPAMWQAFRRHVFEREPAVRVADELGPVAELGAPR
jgi:hypothetical protein